MTIMNIGRRHRVEAVCVDLLLSAVLGAAAAVPLLFIY